MNRAYVLMQGSRPVAVYHSRAEVAEAEARGDGEYFYETDIHDRSELQRVFELAVSASVAQGSGYSTARYRALIDALAALSGKDQNFWMNEVQIYHTRMQIRTQSFNEVRERLESFRDLDQGWDSYESLPITDSAIAFSKILLRLLQLGPPQVVPTSSGGVQLEWHDGRYEFELEISADGETVVGHF